MNAEDLYCKSSDGPQKTSSDIDFIFDCVKYTDFVDAIFSIDYNMVWDGFGDTLRPDARPTI